MAETDDISAKGASENDKYYQICQAQAQKIIKNQDHTTAEIFGNYKEEPIKKEKDNSFVPKYRFLSPSTKKNLELYGFDNNNQKIISPKTNESISNHKDLKFREQSSNIFNIEKEFPIQSPKENKEKLYPSHTTWTDPVPLKDSSHSEKNTQKSPEFAKTLLDSSNKDKRKNDRNFSDLFGRESKPVSKNIEKYKTSTSMKWTDIDSSKMNSELPKNNQVVSPRIRQKDHLKSELDSEDLKKARQQIYTIDPIPENNDERKFVLNKNVDGKMLNKLQMSSQIIPDYKNPVLNKDETNAEIFDFDIKGLKNNFDEARFNLFCKKNGYHVVSFQSDYNGVLNKVGKNGRIKLRANDQKQINTIKNNLNQVGIDVVPHTENNSRKKNYLDTAKVDWKEDLLPQEENRLHSRNFLSPQHSKMQDLESEGEVFGNSPGVGKWNDDWKMSKINKKTDNSQAMEKWKTTIKNFDNKPEKSKKIFTPVLSTKNSRK